MILIGFIFAQVIIFVVIIIVLKKLIFQDTNSAVNRLTQLDDINREKERQLMTRLEEADRMMVQRKAELAEEEKRMKQESERAANQLHEDLVKKAKGEAEEIVKKAISVRDKMRVDAMIEAETKVIDFTKELMAKVMTPIMDDQMTNRLAESFMKDLEEADLNIISKNVTHVDLCASGKLREEVVDRVKELLVRKMERPIEVQVHEDPSLIAGVSLKFGTLMIDDSFSEKLRAASVELKDSLAWKYKI